MVMDQPADRTLAALRMSSITGPNEGAVMRQRAVFGLLRWETLPGDARERTIRDLALALLDDAEAKSALLLARAALPAISAEARATIAQALREKRVPPDQLARLGLAGDPGR